MTWRDKKAEKLEVELWKAAKKCDAAAIQEVLEKIAATTSAEDDTNGTSAIDRVHPRKGTTALMEAVTHCQAQCVMLLLSGGADPNVVDSTKRENTALHYAAYHNFHVGIDMLLQAGADIHALNRRGHSALDIARIRRAPEANAIFMRALRIQRGWLTMKGSWPAAQTKYWCVLLASNRDKSVLELALFYLKGDIRPHTMLLLEPGAKSTASNCKLKLFGSEKYHLFQLSKPINQISFVRKMCRDLRQVSERSKVSLTEFACDVDILRDQWVFALNNPTVYEQQPISVSYESATGSPASQPNGSDHGEWRGQEPMVHPVMPVPPMESVPVAVPITLFENAGMGQLPTRTGDQTTRLNATSAVSYSSSTEYYTQPEPSAPGLWEEDGGEFSGAPSSASPPAHELSSGRNGPGGALHHSIAPAAPSLEDRSSEKECLICMDSDKDSICVPCGHMAGCHACLTNVVAVEASCPICRANVNSVVKVYQC